MQESSRLVTGLPSATALHYAPILVNQGSVPVNKVLRIILWPVTRFLRWVWRLFLAVLRRVMANGVTGTASQFAYNTFLATVPFLFVVVTAINMSEPDRLQGAVRRAQGDDPRDQRADATRSSKNTARGTAAGMVILFGVIAGLYVASNAIGALVDGLDRAQHLNHRPWWRGKLINFGFAAGASVLAVVEHACPRRRAASWCAGSAGCSGRAPSSATSRTPSRCRSAS